MKLCLSWASGQSTASIRMKNILPELREEKLPPQTQQCKAGKLGCARWTTSGFTKAFTKAEFGPRLRKEKCIQHLLPRKNQACQLLLNTRGQACGVTTDSSSRVPRPRLPGCPPALRHHARRGEHPPPLCPYPGIRESSHSSPATHPSEIPLPWLQRRQKTPFL